MAAMTLTETILARHAGRDVVRPDDNIWVDADVLMTHDVCGPGTIGIFKQHFGQISRALGYGINQNASHGRPRWMIGNIAPIINANTVITSAQRVTGRRQVALTRRRIAEISVPA